MLKKAPEKLHKQDFPSFGRYEGLIPNTDITSWQTGFFDRRFKRKGWLYAGIYNAEFALGFAIADTGYLGKAFIYCYHFPTNTFLEEAAQFPFYFAEKFMPSLHSEWLFNKGNKTWQVSPNYSDLEIHFEGKKLQVDFSLIDFEKGMSTIAPALDQPFNFTFKNAGIKTKATIRLKGNEYNLEGNYAVLDFTLGFPPRNTRWNWASATGKTVTGASVGINLVAHFNSDLENVLFFNEQLIPLGKTIFNYTSPADKSIWHITTEDAIIDMHFTPSGARKDHINVGFLKHQFIQPFGKFEGTLLINKEKISFTAFGVTEEHHSVW